MSMISTPYDMNRHWQLPSANWGAVQNSIGRKKEFLLWRAFPHSGPEGTSPTCILRISCPLLGSRAFASPPHCFLPLQRRATGFQPVGYVPEFAFIYFPRSVMSCCCRDIRVHGKMEGRISWRAATFCQTGAYQIWIARYLR